MTAIMADLTRLNYSISEELEVELNAYCELTGRKASDVVRQLICEVLEDDRQLPTPATVAEFAKNSPRRDGRTDMWIAPKILNAFDEKLEVEGYPGKSTVIAYLLGGFLKSRSNHAAEEMVRTPIFIDRETYARLGTLGAPHGKSAEQMIAEVARDYAKKSKASKN